MSLRKGVYIPWSQYMQIVVNNEARYFNGLGHASNGVYLLYHLIILFICIWQISPTYAYLKYPITSIFPKFGQKIYKIRKLLENRNVNLASRKDMNLRGRSANSILNMLNMLILLNAWITKTDIQIKFKIDVRKLSILYVFYSLCSMCYVYNYAIFNIQNFHPIWKYRTWVFDLWCRNVRSISLRFSLFANYIVQLKNFFLKMNKSRKPNRTFFIKLKNNRKLKTFRNFRNFRKVLMIKIFLFQNHPT